MKAPDCYFFVDGDGSDGDRRIRPMHVGCRDDRPSWFYKGSEEGYGPFLYRCAVCGEDIYDNRKNEEKEDQTAGQDARR